MRTRLPLLLLLLAACSSAPTPPDGEPLTVYDPQHEADLTKADEARREFQAVLIRLDQAMESYSQSLANRGTLRADQQIVKLEKLIHEMVLDSKAQNPRNPASAHPPGTTLRRLEAAAADASQPEQQGIALAALGFSGRIEEMPTILQGAQLDDPARVDRAVFGLAILRAPATPPGVLAAVVENEKFGEASRTQAAWAIYNLQEFSEHREQIVAIWKRYATELREKLPAGVIVQAVRGLGLSRDRAHLPLVLPFLQNPVPKIREAAAVALGRLNAQDHFEELLALIGPGEAVPNVRLAARKALQELAGQVDYGYDVAAWRKAFDRGR